MPEVNSVLNHMKEFSEQVNIYIVAIILANIYLLHIAIYRLFLAAGRDTQTNP